MEFELQLADGLEGISLTHNGPGEITVHGVYTTKKKVEEIKETIGAIKDLHPGDMFDTLECIDRSTEIDYGFPTKEEGEEFLEDRNLDKYFKVVEYVEPPYYNPGGGFYHPGDNI